MATAYVFTLRTSNIRFLVWAFGDGAGQSRAEIVQPPHGNRTEHVRLPCGDGTVTVRSSCNFGHSCTKSVQLHSSACVVG